MTDIDGTPTSVSWQWALGASASGPFAPISGATNSTYTTVAVDVNRYLRATASYTDPQGSGKSANAVTGQISRKQRRAGIPLQRDRLPQRAREQRNGDERRGARCRD